MPHNLDFRGRAYPIPPHLSHIGDDLSRSLLKFAEGKELGERGLRWLKIHAANLFGYDKVNFQDRVNWVDEHLEQIKECATNPLEVCRRAVAACVNVHSCLFFADRARGGGKRPAIHGSSSRHAWS